MALDDKELEKYREKVQGYLKAMRASLADAKDIAQEVLIAALPYLSKVRKFDALLYAIAKRKYLNFIDKEKKPGAAPLDSASA